MSKAERGALLGAIIAMALGGLWAWAGSQGTQEVAGYPLFALAALWAFALNWIIFVPSFLAHTEHYFDATGSLTYLTLAVGTLWLTGASDPRVLLLAAMVVLWALRLGTFLFARVRADGRDGRFDALKVSFPRFFMTWTLQGLWVLITMGAALAAMASDQSVALGPFALAGGSLWLLGFILEVIADGQKRAFRRDPNNEGAFIQSGLWALCRHPNYLGEILLWLGVSLVAVPVLSGWQQLTLLSPVFVFVLLTRISGIPMLASRGKRRWGNDPAYQAYLDRTPVLFPRPLGRIRAPRRRRP